MSLPRTSSGKVATGTVAGRPVGLPVRRSKREPCSQHSTVQSSTSPSLSATAAWEQRSWTAKYSPSRPAIATSYSPIVTPSASSVGTSPTEQARSKVISRPPRRCSRKERSGRSGERRGVLVSRPDLPEQVLRQLRLDGLAQPVLDRGDADLADQVVEEPVHDQAVRLLLRDATRAQVEQ